MICNSAEAQIRWRWSHHRWDTEAGFITRWDKVDHFIVAPFVYVGFRTIFKLNKLESFICTALILIMWEVKDAIIWDTGGNRWGGDGFCCKDLTAGFAGIITFCSVDLFGR